VRPEGQLRRARPGRRRLRRRRRPRGPRRAAAARSRASRPTSTPPSSTEWRPSPRGSTGCFCGWRRPPGSLSVGAPGAAGEEEAGPAGAAAAAAARAPVRRRLGALRGAAERGASRRRRRGLSRLLRGQRPPLRAASAVPRARAPSLGSQATEKKKERRKKKKTRKKKKKGAVPRLRAAPRSPPPTPSLSLPPSPEGPPLLLSEGERPTDSAHRGARSGGEA